MAHKTTNLNASMAANPVIGPFVKILFGSKQELYVNLNCSVLSFMRLSDFFVVFTARFVQKETGVPEREFDLCTDKGTIVDIQSIYCGDDGPLSKVSLEDAAEDSLENHLKARGVYILLKVGFGEVLINRLLSKSMKDRPRAAHDGCNLG
jgi:hypothetical protein